MLGPGPQLEASRARGGRKGLSPQGLAEGTRAGLALDERPRSQASGALLQLEPWLHPSSSAPAARSCCSEAGGGGRGPGSGAEAGEEAHHSGGRRRAPRAGRQLETRLGPKQAAARSPGSCAGNKGHGRLSPRPPAAPRLGPHSPEDGRPPPRLGPQALRPGPSASPPLVLDPPRPRAHPRGSPRNSPPRPTCSSSSSLRTLRDRPQAAGAVGRTGAPRTALPQFTLPARSSKQPPPALPTTSRSNLIGRGREEAEIHGG